MPSFHYQALDHEQQFVTGDIQAETVSQAIADLEARGLIVQSIGPAPQESTADTARSAETQPTAAAPPVATKAVPVEDDDGQAVLRSGIQGVLEQAEAIAPALRAYAEEMPPGRGRRQLRLVIRAIEEGDVGKATRTFGVLADYWVPLLGAAAASREPGQILQEFAERARQAEELRHQWWLVLAYPLFVAGVAAAVVVALCLLVVPTFRDVFYGFGLELPDVTLVLIAVSDFIRSGWAVVLAVGLLAAGILAYGASRVLPGSVRARLGRLVPLRYGRAISIGRLAAFTADLLEAGLNMPDALRVAGLATHRQHLRRAAAGFASDIDSNRGAQQPGQGSVLTATLVYALTAELPSASRVRLLREIGQCHAERARIRLSWTRGLIGPLAIYAVGLVVACTVLALFLPLIRLLEGLGPW